MGMPSKERVMVWLWLEEKGKQGMWLEPGEVGWVCLCIINFTVCFPHHSSFPTLHIHHYHLIWRAM